MGDKKYSEKEVMEEIKVQVEESVEETKDVTDIKPKPFAIGCVYRCIKLNVRKQPDINSEIIFELKRGTKVDIYQILDHALNKWYYIIADVLIDNELGKTIEGWVMSDFIEVGE